MNEKTKAQDTVTLSLNAVLNIVDELALPADSGNTEYSTRSKLKLYLYMLVKHVMGFKTLAKQLRLKDGLLSQFGLTAPPHRTTLSRRFKQLPLVLRAQVRTIHADFVAEGVTPVDAMSVDSSLMHAQVKAESLSIFNAHLLATSGTRSSEPKGSCRAVATSTRRRIGARAAVGSGSTATGFTVW